MRGQRTEDRGQSRRVRPRRTSRVAQVCLSALILTGLAAVHAVAAEPTKPKAITRSVQAILATNPRTPADWARPAETTPPTETITIAISHFAFIAGSLSWQQYSDPVRH